MLNSLFSISYIGEILSLISLFYLLFYLLSRNTFPKYISKIFKLLILLIIVGLLSNFFSDVSRDSFAIFIDILTYIKVFTCFGASSLYFNKKNNNLKIRILSTLAFLSRIFVFIGIFCYIFNPILNLNMYSADVRYGIPAFKFIFSSAGMFNQYWIGIILILTADLQNSATIYKKIVVALALIFWLTCLRSRAFVMVLAYIMILLYLSLGKKINKEFSKKIFKIQKIIPVIIVILLLGKKQIINYFFSGKDTARGLLLINGFKIMLDYFPLGSGFATYGTEVAKTYYSPLYYKYFMNNFWALSEGGSELTDCFWPAIAGEIGIFGIIIFLFILYNFFKECILKSKKQKFIFHTVIIEIIYLLISSTATGIFFTDITATYLIFLGLVINIKTKDEEV